MVNPVIKLNATSSVSDFLIFTTSSRTTYLQFHLTNLNILSLIIIVIKKIVMTMTMILTMTMIMTNHLKGVSGGFSKNENPKNIH